MLWTVVKLVQGENPWTTFMKRQVTIKNNCINLISTGGVGQGKSWSLLSQFCMIDPDFNLDEQCFFNAEDLMKAFEQDRIIKGKPFLYDEAGIDISNLNWWDDVNKGLKAFFSTGRHRNYIFGMTVPYLSFISKGVRTLMNCHWRAEGWTSNNLTKIKPFILEYNGDMDKFYRKRLLIKTKKGLIYCNGLRLPKPPKKIIIDYERRKTKFTTALYKVLRERMEKQREKYEHKDTINLTYKQNEVLKHLKEGMGAEEIAKELKCSSRNVYEIIERLKKKNIDIKSKYDKNEPYTVK